MVLLHPLVYRVGYTCNIQKRYSLPIEGHLMSKLLGNTILIYKEENQKVLVDLNKNIDFIQPEEQICVENVYIYS